MDRSMHRDVRTLQRRVESWRRSGGGRGSRIPESLWQEAAAVARTAGVYATARALRFNYENLKKRMAVLQAASPRKERPVEFVTLVPQVNTGVQVVIELISGDGERMRIEAGGGASGVDVVGLAEGFWRRRS